MKVSESAELLAENVARGPQQRGTEGQKCLDDHTSLDGNVIRTSDIQSLERWDKSQLFTTRHVSWIFVFGKGELLSIRKLGSASLREARLNVILQVWCFSTEGTPV